MKGRAPEKYLDRKNMKKMGRFIQFALSATEFAMEESGLKITEENADRAGVYVGSGIGGFGVIEREYGRMMAGGRARRVSPFFVSATIANLASGHISIKYGAAGPNFRRRG